MPSAPTDHFSAVSAQENTYHVWKWLCVKHYPIDKDRMYGIGLSIRAHRDVDGLRLDPRGPMFAAVAELTGTVDIADSWFYADAASRSFLESIFRGTPAAVPFAYQQVFRSAATVATTCGCSAATTCPRTSGTCPWRSGMKPEDRSRTS
ncbi:MAG: hypothetical protein R3E96_16160 [Planctomycetota bacterium]